MGRGACAPMAWRGGDHPGRGPTWNAKCSKCGEQTSVPFDPKTPGKVVMCRNCRAIYL